MALDSHRFNVLWLGLADVAPFGRAGKENRNAMDLLGLGENILREFGRKTERELS